MTIYQVFVPYVRQGTAQLIQPEDFSNDLKARVSLGDIKTKLNVAGDMSPIPARLYAPGEVIGFDSLHVIRTEPPPLTTNFEPNYFPFVEFDRPDFPWLLTPARATKDGKLRPWIALVVVPDCDLEISPAAPLPILKTNLNELPDLKESWLTAHAQVVIEASEEDSKDVPINQALNREPAANLSRLLCLRRLAPNSKYLACVVPAFSTGVEAGLNGNVSLNDDDLKDAGDVEEQNHTKDDDLKDAWDVEEQNHTKDIFLPVYYSWRFATGPEGDFETLALRLKPADETVQAGFSGRPLSLDPTPANPGLSPPPDPEQVDKWQRLAGAMKPAASTETETPTTPLPLAPNFVGSLQKQVNAESLKEQVNDGDNPADLDETMPVPPPLYGRWHAKRKEADQTKTGQCWFDELNLHPVHRIAASLGTQVVQENQEDLMAEAWRQVGEIERANQLIRQAQLSRDAQNRIYDKLLGNANTLLALEKLNLIAPLFDHIPVGQERATARSLVNRNVTVGPSFSAAFRRLTRPRGPIGRRLAQSKSPTPEKALANFASEVNSVDLGQARELSAKEARGFTFNETFKETFLAMGRPEWGEQSVVEWAKGGAVLLKASPVAQSSAVQVLEKLAERLDLKDLAPPNSNSVDLRSIGVAVVNETNPEDTVPRLLRGRVHGALAASSVASLSPIMVAPKLLFPVFPMLRDISPEYVLPGVSDIPQNTVAAVTVNQVFIEALMVGANHEMGRELLWREFPTDQRGTCLSHFWDPAGRIPPADPEVTKGIKEIHEWGAEARLGGNWAPPKNDQNDPVDPNNLTVLIVRGELLLRYPRTIIAMIKAKDGPVPDKDAGLVSPLYRGALPPDIVFFMFDILPATAGGNPGYFFVFQEPPTEVRFGLNETGDDRPAPGDKHDLSWDDLSWDDVTTREGGHLQFADGPRDESPFSSQNLNKWGKSDPPHSLPLRSDEFAGLVRQQPFQIFIHAADLLPQ